MTAFVPYSYEPQKQKATNVVYGEKKKCPPVVVFESVCFVDLNKQKNYTPKLVVCLHSKLKHGKTSHIAAQAGSNRFHAGGDYVALGRHRLDTSSPTSSARRSLNFYSLEATRH